MKSPAKNEKKKVLIQALVKGYGHLSRTQIRQLTQMRGTTVSLLVRELIREGRLVEAGRSNNNPMGRKQILLRLNEEFGFIVGIEFDAETVVAALMDLHPAIKSVVRKATRLDDGIEGLVKQLLSCAHQAIQQAGVDQQKLAGIGVADPGLVDSQAGLSVSCTTIDFWKQVPLKKTFEEEFGVPLVLESATRARTVAERVLGAGNLTQDMIYIEYGRGIGAGVVINGEILRGHAGSAGEFGHIPLLQNGPACKCGSFGCLEAIIGAGALEASCRKAILEGGGSLALEFAHGDAEKITGWTVLSAAKSGDKTCLTIVAELEKYLGLGIATLVNLFNPSLVVIDQRLELAGEDVLDQIRRVVKRQALARSTDNLEFRYGKLGNEAGPLGVGLLVLETMFRIPALRPPRFVADASRFETAVSHQENGPGHDSATTAMFSDMRARTAVPLTARPSPKIRP